MLSLYLVLALLAGVIIGTLTGLFPGIHANLIAAFLISLSALAIFSNIPPIIPVIFLVSLSITHTFLDYLPSIFLGAPDEDNFLSILPGHEFLLKGKAHSAIVYTLYGGLAALLIILLLTPLFLYLLNPIYARIERIMPFILITACFFLIYFEKKSRATAIFIFFISGILGIASSNLPSPNYLLPLFTGLFGVSSLITSIMKTQKIPKQKITPLKKIKLSKKSLRKTLLATLIASPFASFLPGLGASQAATIGSEVTKDLNQKEFLLLLGTINTLVMGLSFITLYTIGKTRTGISAAIKNLISLTFSDLIYLLIAVVISGILSFFIALYLSKIISKYIHKINYKILSLITLCLLFIVIIFFSGFYGFLILIVSSALGLLTIFLGVKRTHLMGSLLVPTILFYLL